MEQGVGHLNLKCERKNTLPSKLLRYLHELDVQRVFDCLQHEHRVRGRPGFHVDVHVDLAFPATAAAAATIAKKNRGPPPALPLHGSLDCAEPLPEDVRAPPIVFIRCSIVPILRRCCTWCCRRRRRCCSCRGSALQSRRTVRRRRPQAQGAAVTLARRHCGVHLALEGLPEYLEVVDVTAVEAF